MTTLSSQRDGIPHLPMSYFVCVHVCMDYETRSHCVACTQYVAQAILKLVIFLPESPK